MGETIQILELFGGIGSPRCALRNLNIPTKAMVMVKLENIADDLKDIKRESRENREEMKTLRERIVIVEQALKRLDGE